VAKGQRKARDNRICNKPGIPIEPDAALRKRPAVPAEPRSIRQVDRAHRIRSYIAVPAGSADA